ncbi:MAG: hypothetical protein F6K04_13655 [Leptolyngbya sp. SIO4C5]|nr:hypothetical protein [Leptolyngbya sp. SIO4C5]
MIGFTASGLVKKQPSPSIRQRLWQATKEFWAFSNFYGEYQSLAPHQRRQQLAKLEADAKRSLEA